MRSACRVEFGRDPCAAAAPVRVAEHRQTRFGKPLSQILSRGITPPMAMKLHRAPRTLITLRHDHGSTYISADFQRVIRFLGMTSSRAFVRLPEGNGVAERAIRTPKEQLFWIRHFATVDELLLALAGFAALHNASWLRERHGHRTPDQIRAGQTALETEAATEFNSAV